MANKTLLLVLLCLITGTLLAQEPKVTPLMSKDLTDIPSKEGLMITVEYAPQPGAPILRLLWNGKSTLFTERIVSQRRAENSFRRYKIAESIGQAK